MTGFCNINNEMSVSRLAIVCLLGGVGVCGMRAAIAAQPADSQEKTVDWPTAISRLRQEVEQRPGYAFSRQQLALAYNNYGVSLGNDSHWEEAIQQLQQAVQLDQTNGQFRGNLCNLYFNRAHDAYQHHRIEEATDSLDAALMLNPKYAPAYALRGDIEYDRQKLKEAKTAWQQALTLDPRQQQIAQKLEQVTHELPVESKFERLSQAYFDLRYQEGLDRPTGFDIRDALLEARRVVGSDFAYWPRGKIVVLIYSAESFRALRQETPEWVGGQFDGKIRVPLPGAQLDLPTVKQILTHEYTHAVIHDLANGKCPVWLNEGLAEYEGYRYKPLAFPHLGRAYQAGHVISWVQLSDQFSAALPVDLVAMAYQESHSIARYLISRYGMWRIRRLLKTIGEGTPWDTAFTEEFRMKLPKLEASWRDWLPELLSSGTATY